ncbi:hypothetical protein [Romboutsia sp. Marseille-P6047]|uniref:hypothetical protein n=1 Tax=Romboutsia sp. Marseille-P6047 TaxID=2161817 RepID=UPI000F066639|nr:hypothetical protein [Romboutsia sp. Marseille-P6047]
MMLIVNLIAISLQNSYKFAESNKNTIEMVNIAESYINDKKEIIKSAKEINKLQEQNQIGKYKIESTIKKDENIYRCYKLNVKVTYQDKNLEVSTYVTKK